MHIRCGEQVTGIQFHRTQIYLSAPSLKYQKQYYFVVSLTSTVCTSGPPKSMSRAHESS